MIGGAVTTVTAAATHYAQTAVFVAVVILLALLYVGWRTGRLGKLRGAAARLRLRNEMKDVRIRPVTLLPLALLLIVIVLVLISQK